MTKHRKLPDPKSLDKEEEPPTEPEEDSESSVYDSEDGLERSDSSSEGEFEQQGSSEDDDDRLESQMQEDESDDEIAVSYEKQPRNWKSLSGTKTKSNSIDAAALMHTDDISSDDEDDEGTQNRIGRVPLHWYDDYDHIGYNIHGSKVVKGTAQGDRLDQALAMQDNLANGKFVVHDALNDRNVELTQRQLELIRRVQGGAFAHPEHDANPDFSDYFSGINPEISGLHSNRYEPKARFQPSKWEKLQVERLLDRLEKGKINMDYLTGKIRDMNDVDREDPDKPFLLWTGDEDDELSMRKGPQHIGAPKLPPPGHAESYRPPEEYLPTEEDLEKWAEMDPKDRPHGLLIPKQFPNLRSVGSYQHSVREAFERCLDLYLCPRVLKRRLNIDPESLVPRLPKSGDLKPFPTTKCIEYQTPFEGTTAPVIRAVTASPDGQYMASGGSDGFVRLWEVETGRLLRSWDVSTAVVQACSEESEPASPKAVVCLEWNPNRSHHCLLAGVGNCVVLLASGTAGKDEAEVTDALFSTALQGGNVNNARASKVVQWISLPGRVPRDKPVSTFNHHSGPICAVRTSREVGHLRWQAKGDYFVSVSPKAGASAVLIHQLSKGNSQQPFGKAKGEPQLACFHPNKPFLFVASQQHVRVYHLVKQNMVKRLVTGCRWISSIDVHSSGDHLVVGTLDRRMLWFDLDFGAAPYKTLKYHERAIRSSRFHGRYPLLASASDDGTVHVFHSMVYNDLMRNPLIVPVKVLRGHTVTNKLGVLTVCFHPRQPWIFTGGADGKIFLFQDI